MRKKIDGVKAHIISMRISDDEKEALRTVMKSMKLGSVSDVMREAFKQIASQSTASTIAPGETSALGARQ